MRIETKALTGDSPGAQRSLSLCSFGATGQGPKVYLQAGLHADEMPGILVLQHLIPLLERAETEGRIIGEILVVPVANPLGLQQFSHGRPLGRFDADSGQNYNRGFPALGPMVAEAVADRLTDDADANRDLIRAAFRTALDAAEPRGDMAQMQHTLLRWSCDADHVLDLHCDYASVMHLYATPARPDVTTLLARATGAVLALIQDDSGGNSFDEAHTVPWLKLRDRFGDEFPIPTPCFATTLEYRGQLDVSDDLAASDAHNLLVFLAAIGAVFGPAAPLHPDALHLPLGGSAEVHAPQGGVLTWIAEPGDWVEKEQVLAHVTDPLTRARLPILSPTTGMMFRRELWPQALRGQCLAHVAGETILRSGYLLAD